MPEIEMPGEPLEAMIAEIEAMERVAKSTAQSVRDIADAAGMAVDQVRRRLRQLKAEGRLEVTRKEVERLDGQRGIVPAYIIRKGTKPPTAGRRRQEANRK